MSIRKLFCCFLLMLAGAISIPCVRAGDLASPGSQPTVEARAAIRQALAKKINWAFLEKPLEFVVEDLTKELNIPMRMDSRTLNDLGVASDTPVTFKISDITAKSALSLMLRDFGLTTMVRDEVLVITSLEEAENQLETIVYDVSDLPAFRRPSGGTSPDYEQLIDVITSSLKMVSWSEVGGPGSINPYDAGDTQALVVSQTGDVHEEISNLLDNLRSLRHSPLKPEEIEKLPPLPLPTPKPPMPMPKAMSMGEAKGSFDDSPRRGGMGFF
jgi:hypothetical protein